MSAAEHGRQHRVFVSGEGQGRGRVGMTTDVQFDPALVDLIAGGRTSFLTCRRFTLALERI